MQGATSSPVDPTMTWVVLACLMVATAMLLFSMRSSFRGASDPLSGLFAAPRFEAEAEAAEKGIEQAKEHLAKEQQRAQTKFHERRVAPSHPRGSVLRGRIDHLSQVRSVWGEGARKEAISEVARVMRAGLRDTDIVVEAEGPAGDASFIILAKDASEEEASSIAKRLLRGIAMAKVEGMDKGFGLTASFGVAARRPNETATEWHARAGSALDAAQTSGEDYVMSASEWEEVVLLPPPSRNADAAKSA